MLRERGRDWRRGRAAVALAALGLALGAATLVLPDAGVLAGHLTRKPPPRQAAAVGGQVVSPVLGQVDPGEIERRNADEPDVISEIVVSGLVSVGPDQWTMKVEVLKQASADPADDGNWEEVDRFDATGGGLSGFTFSKAIRAFEGRPDAWRPGGLGRLRVAAVNKDTGQTVYLPVRDADGVTPANQTVIVLAETAPDPTQPPGKLRTTIRNPFETSTPNYLAVNTGVKSFPPGDASRQESAAREYYAYVRTGPNGGGAPIASALPTLKAFIARYFGPLDGHAEDEPERVTKYFNKGDLGIGREMHCINRGSTQELACYVKNLGRLDGLPVFDDKGQARRALLANRPFASVAMVERQQMAADDPNRVFFLVYQHTRGSGDPQNTRLALKAQLDNKGYNTSIPGNCLQCHGINSTYTIAPDADGNNVHEVRNAMFLPFDLEAFEYFSDDPNSNLSRAKQEGAFRAHNRMVRRFSALGRAEDARDLIGKWYADDLSDGGGEPFRSAVPSGWQGDAGQEQLYKGLVAIACRTCHISYVPTPADNRPALKFASFDDFRQQQGLVRALMCTTHRQNPRRMPAAEQTLKVLWQSAGRAQLFGQIPGAFGDCGL